MKSLATGGAGAGKGSAGRDVAIALAVFGVAFVALHASPVASVGDSKYTLLLTEQLLVQQRFQLDPYFWPHVDSSSYPAVRSGMLPRHVRRRAGHLYYYYPPGSSILSLPVVALARAVGVSTIDAQGRYDFQAEKRLQRLAAAAFTAAAAALFFLTARLCLPLRWSLLVAFAGIFATQGWSTLSRSLQAHTCGVFLLSVVVYLLLRAEQRGERCRPVLLGSILSWGFFVRPTAAFTIAPIVSFIAITRRRELPALVATGALWLAAFVAYSQHHFGTWLPEYYTQGHRFQWESWWTGFSAQMISPSRGLLVYVPLVLVVGYLLAAYRHRLQHRGLVRTALAAIAIHCTVVAGYGNFWGGSSYGPRFHADLLPLFVLLGILGLRAALDDRSAAGGHGAPRLRRVLEPAAFVASLLIGVAIHGAGALSGAHGRWNREPVHVSEDPMRVFDWSRPQWAVALFPGRFPPASLEGGDG